MSASWRLILRHVKEPLKVLPDTSVPSCAMAQTVSCQPVTVEAQVCARVSPCGICGGLSGTGTFFSDFYSFSLSVSFYWGFIFIYII
jgi:hypothetical protein